jgi:osmotically-inducible protein OsmY
MLARISLRIAMAWALVAPQQAAAAFDPVVSLAGKGITTAMDARTAAEVTNDIQIDAALTKKLLEQKGDGFKEVSSLVFAQHVVLVGYAKDAGIRQKAEALARAGKLARSIKNDILVGRSSGSFGANLVLDKKIDFTLTATKGVSSVNMRWKVYGSVVFLAGVAQSAAEARLAAAKIRSVGGVKILRSHLRVVSRKSAASPGAGKGGEKQSGMPKAGGQGKVQVP